MKENNTHRWFPKDGLAFESTTWEEDDGSKGKAYAVRVQNQRVVLTSEEALGLSRAMHDAGVFQ